MGLLNEIAELKNECRLAELKREETLKEIAKLERQQAIMNEQKIYEKDMKKAIENELKATFDDFFYKNGLEVGLNILSLLETRENIIKNIAETSNESDFLHENYERILNKVKKKYENDFKARERINKENYNCDPTTTPSNIKIFFQVIGRIIKFLFKITLGIIYLFYRILITLTEKN